MIITIWTYEVAAFFIARLRPSIENVSASRACPHLETLGLGFLSAIRTTFIHREMLLEEPLATT